jgi:hypothetical protein
VKKIFWILVLVIAAVLLWMWWTGRIGARAQDRGEKIAYNRIWVDHLPKDDRDTINVFAAITEEPIGIFQATSVWRGNFELFRYEPHGDGKAVFMYPQTKDKERVSYRARNCSQDGFDFCMELDGASRGVKRYFSQKGWEIRGASLPSIESKIQSLLPSRR